jgi:hypothetical protein
MSVGRYAGLWIMKKTGMHHLTKKREGEEGANRLDISDDLTNNDADVVGLLNPHQNL